ncbi:MAG: hypothetical protein ACQEXJ_16075 [Myxococcota bacterium]
MDLRGLEPPSGPPSDLREILAAVDPFAHGDPAAWRLREVLAEGSGAGPEHVIPGGDDLVGLACRAVLGPADRVALAAPGRAAFEREVAACGARYVDVGRDQAFRVQEEALDRVLSDGDVRLVILGRPAVPAGAVARLHPVRRALDAGAFVLVDEADLPLADGRSESALSLLRGPDAPGRLIVRTRVAPALAIGPLRADALWAAPDVAERLWALRPEVPLSRAAQVSALHLLEHPEAAEEAAEALIRTREALRERLLAAGGLDVPPSDGPCLLVRRPGTPGEDLASALSRAGVLVDWSSHWTWRDAVRLRIPAPEHLDRVVATFSDA